MELYDMMTNLLGKNTESELVSAISSVRKKLKYLDEDRMCKVYSDFLLKELLNRHISSRLINTLDFGFNYEHFFILVKKYDDGYFLVDLTFSQFNSYSLYFSKLLIDGYQTIDDKGINDYLSIITREKSMNNISLDRMFFSKQL